MNLPLIDGVCQQHYVIFLQTIFFNLNFLPRNSMCSFRLDAGCPLLPPIDNGHVDILQPNIIGTSAKYTCSTGFFLAGRAIRKCTSDGAWDGREPSCEKGFSKVVFTLPVTSFLNAFLQHIGTPSLPILKSRYTHIHTHLHSQTVIHLENKTESLVKSL
uniref:Sushi domain-containing protein n=1 Tax=Octopus bimaculoides TaxID=37653 RepID=A0A0L8I5F9_OCTBM